MVVELTLIEKAFFLKKTTLFAELDLDLVLAIASKADVRYCEDLECIFSCNQDAHCLYVIIEGTVAIKDPDEHVIEILKAPDYFGDESLFNREPRRYSTSAEGAVGLLLISRSHLSEIILECPQVALALIRAFASCCPYRKRKNEE